MKLSTEELRRFAELAAGAEAARVAASPRSFAELVEERRAALGRHG